MGGFLGIGGSSAKTDRGNVLTGFSNLKNLFNWGLPFASKTATAGTGTTEAGLSDLNKSGDWYKQLLSGSRAAVNQAVAPETSAVLSQSDADKRQLANMGTARGGGVAATNQQRKADTMAKVDQMIFGVRPNAASGVADVGSREASVGQQQIMNANQTAGISEYAANDLTRNATQSRELSAKLNMDAQRNVVGAIEGFLKAFV